MFRSFPHSLIGLFVFLLLSCMGCLYILEINLLSVVSFAIIFSHSEGCLFTWLIVTSTVKKLKNLLIGQQWRNRHTEQTYGMGRVEERARCMERVIWKFTLPYVKQIANGNLLQAQETHTGALYQPRGVGQGGRQKGGSRGRGHMYTCG